MQTGPRQRRSVAVQVTAVRDGGSLVRPDTLVSEEPMEIRVGGPRQRPEPIGVTMRTPGNDFELAAGFLLSEGLLLSQDAIRSVGYCQAPGAATGDGRYNVVTVATAHAIDLEAHRRLLDISSACGMCGRTSLEKVEVRVESLPPTVPWPFETLVALPEALRSRQSLFTETGGLHGAGLFDRAGLVLAVREDVGRHNAVDKLIGWAALSRRLPLHGLALVVSGRLGFEIVQKAAIAGISHVVAVSAPSSLAIDLAQRLGMSIVAFARGDRGNIYCGRQGVRLPS